MSTIQTNKTPDDRNMMTSIFVYLGYGLAAMAGLGETTYLLFGKKYKYLRENINHVLVWQFGAGTLLSIILMGIFESPVLFTNLKQVALVSLHSCLFYSELAPIPVCLSTYLSQHWRIFSIALQWYYPWRCNIQCCRPLILEHRNWMEVLGTVMVLLGSSLGSVWELLKSE